MGDTSVLGRKVLSLAGDSNASQIHTVFFPCHIMCVMHVLWGMILQVFFFLLIQGIDYFTSSCTCSYRT